MQSGKNKLICLLLVTAMLLGVLAGCHQDVHTTPAGSSGQQTPSSTVTVPGTTVPVATTTPSTGPQPTDPQPTEPRPTDPKPTEPQPTDPKPTEPQPTQTQPTGPKPTSTTTQPTQTQPTGSSATGSGADLAPQFPKLTAKMAFAYDTRTGEFLYLSHEASATWYPASITKLFTAYVAMQYLSLEDQITVGQEMTLVELDTSRAGFQIGDVVSVQNLLYGLLIPSGCDSAYILAAHAGMRLLEKEDAEPAEAVQAFVEEMNRQAQALGLENTHFVTADGYHHEEHYVSMQAFSQIAQLCLGHEAIAKVMRTYNKTITVVGADGESRKLNLRTTNKTINPYSQYYHEDAVGMKTGSHTEGGANLLAAYQVEDGHIVIGIFGCSDWNKRFTDANTLFNFIKNLL